MEDDSWLKHFLMPTSLFELICDGFHVDVETKFTRFTCSCSKSLSRNSLHECLGSSQSRSKLVKI